MGLFYAVYSIINGLQLRNNMCIVMAVSFQNNVSLFGNIFQWLIVTFDMVFIILLTVSMFGLLSIIHSSSKSIRAVGKSESAKTSVVRSGHRVLFCCSVMHCAGFLF